MLHSVILMRGRLNEVRGSHIFAQHTQGGSAHNCAQHTPPCSIGDRTFSQSFAKQALSSFFSPSRNQTYVDPSQIHVRTNRTPLCAPLLVSAPTRTTQPFSAHQAPLVRGQNRRKSKNLCVVLGAKCLVRETPQPLPTKHPEPGTPYVAHRATLYQSPFPNLAGPAIAATLVINLPACCESGWL